MTTSDALLSEIRQKIADLAEHVDRYSLIVTQPDDGSRLSGEKIVRRLDEIAAFGLPS